MKERIITALCLIAIVVPAVIFGGIFYKIVIGVAMALSVYEMLHICSRPRIGMYMYIIVGLFFVIIILFILKADVRPRRWRRTGQRQRQFPEF